MAGPGAFRGHERHSLTFPFQGLDQRLTGVEPSRVVLPLSQHVGAPAEPTVQVGSRVSVGDVIAQPAEGKLGAVIHASIAGQVTTVDGNVTIQA